MSSSSREQLVHMIETGNRSGVVELLQQNEGLADMRTEQGISMLVLSFYHRQPEIAEEIRTRKCQPLDIHEAAAIGDCRRLLMVLQDDPDEVSTMSSDGFTALHLAAFLDRPRAANILLAHGARVDEPTSDNRLICPIHSAAASRSSRLVRILLAAGADPDRQQEGGFTALHAAAKHGSEAMVRILLAHGANAELATDEQMTAGDFAAEADHPRILNLLNES